MRTPDKDIFFIGFLKDLPPGLRQFLPVCAVVLLCVFAGLGFVISATQGDAGDGQFRFDLGQQDLIGVVRIDPYPTLTIKTGSDKFPVGHVMMLAGGGKRGAMGLAEFDRRLTRVRGIALTRGDLNMLQIAGGRRAPELAADREDVSGTEDVPLGRWRLAGEICDGKCLAGAMRPGRGLAHKACANLCLIGDVPPVFATTAPVEGHRYLMIAGPDGGAMPMDLLNHTAALIEIEGQVERRGDLLIFYVEPSTLRVL